MTYRLKDQVLQVPVDKLKADPLNATVHADFDPHGADSWLVEDIKQHGVLLPLLVREDGTVRDGHRRLAASRLLRIGAVPCVVKDGNNADETVFLSAQLARNLSIYAKCVLYRQHIKDAQQKRDAIKHGNLRSNYDGAEEAVEEQAQLEQVLGAAMKTLYAGVRLLEWAEEHPDKAGQVLSTFRNRGVRPALRLAGLGERGIPRNNCAPPIPDCGPETPDCGDWGVRGVSDPDDPRAKRPRSPAAWPKTAAGHINKLRKLFDDNMEDATKANTHLTRLEKLLP